MRTLPDDSLTWEEDEEETLDDNELLKRMMHYLDNYAKYFNVAIS